MTIAGIAASLPYEVNNFRSTEPTGWNETEFGPEPRFPDSPLPGSGLPESRRHTSKVNRTLMF
jgi:hypothetical protein